MGVRLWLGFCAYGALSGAALVWRVGEAEAAMRTSSPSPASKPAATGLGARADVQLLPDAVVEHGSDIIIHFMESQLCMLILLNFLCSLYGLLALTLKETLFGKLSPIESHKLTERAIKYASFKVVFVGAYVTPHILNITAWFAWFALLGIVKAFVGLCKDRLDTLMSAPSATRASHIRNFGLLLFLFAGDFAGSLAVCSAFWGSAKSELMLVLFECILIAVEASQTLVRYCIFFAGMWRQLILGASIAAQQGLGTHATWEWQGAVLYHTDLLSELITLALSLCHYCHIWYLHGFSFQLVDAILFLNVRAVVCTLQRRFSAFTRYRAATHNLSVIFPDAKASEIACSDDDCAICKEQMTAAKRLPCGHLFHLHCLRAWLQQSGSDNFTCPICRAPLFLKPEELESSLSHRWSRAQDSTVDNLDRDESGQGNVRMLAHPPGGLVRALFGMNTRVEQGDTAEMRVQDLQLDAGHVLLFEFEQLRARHHGLSQRRLSYLTSTTTSSSVSLQSGTEGLENGNNASISGREPQYQTDPASLMEMEPGSDDEVAKDNVVSSYLLDVSRSVSSARQSKGQAVSIGQSLRSRRNLRMEVEEGEEADSSSKIGQHGNN